MTSWFRCMGTTPSASMCGVPLAHHESETTAWCTAAIREHVSTTSIAYAGASLSSFPLKRACSCWTCPQKASGGAAVASPGFDTVPHACCRYEQLSTRRLYACTADPVWDMQAVEALWRASPVLASRRCLHYWSMVSC